MVWSASSLALLLIATAHGAELQRFEAAEPHMGTLVRITMFAPNEAIAVHAFRRGFARIAELNRILSDYDPHSELSRLREGPPVRVSRDLWTVLSIAQAVSKQTNGAFDSSTGRLNALWRKRVVPAAEDLAAARQATGYQHIRLRSGTVQLLRPGMKLDAGGIAKGYVAEEALKALGLKHALVAISGDLAIGDPPPGRKGWRIEAQGQILELRHCAVSTSGSSEQYFEADGRRYSHILDPRTGWPIDTVHSITVVHSHGAWADALSTALTVTATRSGIRCYTKTCTGTLH